MQKSAFLCVIYLGVVITSVTASPRYKRGEQSDNLLLCTDIQTLDLSFVYDCFIFVMYVSKK